MFDDPDEVRLDREGNRHLAFGSGIHRCAGSNLARLELRASLQVFLERIPEFELVDPDAVTWAGGQVHGPRRCEVRFDVAARRDRRRRGPPGPPDEGGAAAGHGRAGRRAGLRVDLHRRLAGRADVTRATFYAHYASKAALLTAVVDRFADEVIAAFGDQPEGASRMVPLFEEARRSKDIARVILDGEGNGVALRRFAKIVEQILRDDLATGRTVQRFGDVDEDLLVKLRAAQVLGAVSWFIDHDEADAELTARTVHRVLEQGWGSA